MLFDDREGPELREGAPLMALYRLKVWTGPVSVVEIGRRVRRAGFKSYTTGTEHIYVDVKGQTCGGAEHNMRAQLFRKYGKDWGLRAASCQMRKKRRR